MLAGRLTVKVVPALISLAKDRVPPCFLMIPWLTARPRPVPFWSALVVKKGSKILSACSSGIPDPVSVKVMTMEPSWIEDVTRNCPPAFMA